MRSTMITAVGIDISKNKSTVAVRRPGGEIVIRPFEVRHTSSDLKRLTAKLKQLGGDIRVVMEHTGNYWRPVALTLKKAGFFVSVVNAMLIRVSPKFCVKSNECRNRAKFICRRQRHDRLPPISTT